jgi:trans-aconitate methyltransferase
MSGSTDVRNWYNEFSKKQIKTGINLRHYRVFNQILLSGLRRDHRILEVGCGIGTLTSLLRRYLRKGSIVATDISDESVQIAKSLYKDGRVEFIVSDLMDLKITGPFDFIILADVLEHIPMDHHDRVFGLLASLMHNQSRLIIHIPHPKMIEYLMKTSPEQLQVIDQAVHADLLCMNAYKNGLILERYVSYSLFDKVHDYVFIEMKLNSTEEFSPEPKGKIIVRKMINRLKFIFSVTGP